MAYLDRVLQPGERVLARGVLHWIIFVPALFGMVGAAIVGIAAAIALTGSLQLIGFLIAGILAIGAVVRLVAALIATTATEFVVTDRRVIAKRGLFSLHTVEMNVDKVESVDVDQSVFGRMFDYGAVTVHGVGARWDPIAGIAAPLEFRNAITFHAGTANAA